MGLSDGGATRSTDLLQQAWKDQDFVLCVAQALEAKVADDEWLGSWRTDVAPMSDGWMKSVSTRVKAGYLLDAPTLQRFRAVVRPERPRIAPSAAHRLELVVELCDRPRPGPNLKGTSERYTETRDLLESAFVERFGEEWKGRGGFRTNPPAKTLPHTFLPPTEAVRWLSRFSPTVQLAVHKGTQVVNAACYPPVLHRYPRIGAFEISALLFEGERLVAQECIFSKLLSGRWPKVERVVARSHEFVQDALWREQEAQKQAWRQLTDFVEEGYMLHDAQLAELRRAVTANPRQLIELVEEGYGQRAERRLA